MGRAWIDEPRSNVVRLRPRINPNHPSVRGSSPAITLPEINGRWLNDTQLQLIASTLQHPTPQGVQAAVALLMGDAS